MNAFNKKRFWIIPWAALTACSAAQDSEPRAGTIKPSEAADRVDNAKEPNAGVHLTYCFKRVGQIKVEPKRGEVCEVHGGGAGGGDLGSDKPIRNSASFHLSSPSLKAAGVKSFSFVLNRGDATPKFTTGVHVMDQVQLAGKIPDPSFQLPDRMAFVSDVTGTESIFSWSSPDAAYLKANGQGFDFPGFEIASAVLTIESADDLPMDSFETDFARQSGMIIGEQYIEGTLNISLIPMGSKGEMYGPTTFEFGTTIGWGYSK